NLYCCHYKNDKTARTLVINNGSAEPYFMHVHVQCAAWIPTIDTNHIPFTTSLHRLKACKNKCYFCGSRYGFQVDCSHKSGDGGCPNTYHPMCAMRYKFLSPPPAYNVKYTRHYCPRHASKKPAVLVKRRRASDATANVEPKRVTRRQSALPPFPSPADRSEMMDVVSPSPLSANGFKRPETSKETSVSAESVPEQHRVGRQPDELNDEMTDEAGTPQLKKNGQSTGNLSSSKPRFRSARRVGRPRGRSRAPGRQLFYDQVLNMLESEMKDSNSVGYDYEDNGEGEIDEEGNEMIFHDDDYEHHMLSSNGDYVEEEEVVGSGNVVGSGGAGSGSHARNASGSTGTLGQQPVASPLENKTSGSAQGKRITLKFNNTKPWQHSKSNSNSNSNSSISETIDGPIASATSLSKQSNVADAAGKRFRDSKVHASFTQNRAQNAKTVSEGLSTSSKGQLSEDQSQEQQQQQQKQDQDKDKRSQEKQQSPVPQGKRPLIRVRPFAIGSGSGTPQSGTGGINYPLSAGTKFGPSLFALETSQKAAAAAVVKLSQEQERQIKESHEMLSRQNELLESMNKMLKDLYSGTSKQTQETQQALSKISSLSALVSNSQSNGAAGSLNENGIANKNGTVVALPNSNSTRLAKQLSLGAAASTTSMEIAGTVPQRHFSTAAELQLPRSSEPSPKLNADARSAQTRGLLVEMPSFGGLASRVSEGSALSNAKPYLEPNTSESQQKQEQQKQQEMDEMKDNIIYLIKAVNMPQILDDMLSPKAESTSPASASGSKSSAEAATPTSEPKTSYHQLKAMLADLRQIGVISKDNVHEHLKMLANSIKTARNK
ncbi:hypothetical protein FB639_003087, partial [Coemansia asiatica]